MKQPKTALFDFDYGRWLARGNHGRRGRDH